MARNGTGTYIRNNSVFTGATVWQQDRDAGTKITADHHDDHDQDIADALTQSIAKDGQTPITADLPMTGFKHTNVGAANSRTNYAQVAQVQDGAYLWGGTSTGAANTYAITLAPAITAYANGLAVRFLSHQANTGSATLAVNGLTATPIIKSSGNALAASDILNAQLVEVVYSPVGGGELAVSKPSYPSTP